MDSPDRRRYWFARLLHLASVLRDRGGDELAVLVGQADGFVNGLETHGPLDLDLPRDWQREIDQELRDRENYAACRREGQRRDAERAAVPAAIDDDDTPDKIIVDVDDASDPTWVDEGPRLARGRLGRRR